MNYFMACLIRFIDTITNSLKYNHLYKSKQFYDSFHADAINREERIH